MGFLNKILKGLGFEDEEESQPKEIKVKEKKEKKQKSNVGATYNLNELEEEKKEEVVKEQVIEEKQINESPEFEVVKATTQEDIQQVVLKLKMGAKVLLNIEKMSQEDITRSLDFITGAVFALNLKMQKIDDKIFLIQ